MIGKLAAGIVAFSIVALLTLPAVCALLQQLRHLKNRSTVHSDKDGVATETSTVECTAAISKALQLGLSTLGLGTATALAVSEPTRLRSESSAHWLNSGQWGLLFLQAFCISMIRKPTTRFRLGILYALSVVILLAILMYHELFVNTEFMLAKFCTNSTLALRITHPVIAGGALLCSLNFPQRPQVYYKGIVVDGQHTDTALQRCTYGWVGDLLKLARQTKRVEFENLPMMDYATRTSNLLHRWETSDGIRPLTWRIIHNHRTSFVVQLVLTVLESVLSFAPQFVNLRILRMLANRLSGSWSTSNLLIWVFALTIGLFAFSFVEQLNLWISWSLLAVPIRAQLSALIFRKAMSRKDVKGTGNVETEEEQGARSTINLIGVDAKKVSDFGAMNTFLSASVLKFLFATVFLWNILGWLPLVIGFCVLPFTITANLLITRQVRKATNEVFGFRDARLAVMTEALQGIRQIKFAAQESQWQRKIVALRDQELQQQWKSMKWSVALAFCWIVSPIALTAASLSTYALTMGGLDSPTAFTALGIFRNLEIALSAIPELISRYAEAKVSTTRIGEYLDSPESQKITKVATSISFKAASIAWPTEDSRKETDRYVLRNINVSFPVGKLSVVSGKTGSGKSLLLAAILSEADVLEGEISAPDVPTFQSRHDDLANGSNWILPSAIAFVGQIPWIENASIRNNILFGLPFDEVRYKKVVQCCALRKDLQMLPDGEWTEIGANGINLSGGQKWRITFARALYSRAGVLILDDIFGAVDTQVGRYIFEKGLTGDLGMDRTRILVTHHVALCESKASYLVQLGNGVVDQAGSRDTLKMFGPLDKMIAHDQERGLDENDSAIVNYDIETNASKVVTSKTAQKFVEDERREKGRVKFSHYITYFNSSGGWPFWTIAAFILVSNEVLTVGQSWWLKYWTGDGSQISSVSLLLLPPIFRYHLQTASPFLLSTATTNSEASLRFYLGIYIALSASVAVFGTLHFYWLYKGSIRASRRLFEDMCHAVLRTPSRWLDTVPQGRILSRFTGDFVILDNSLAMDLSQMCSAILTLLGVVAAALFVSPWAILVAAILLVCSAWVSYNYITGAREIKRLESIMKSPIFEQFSSALTGITTIRAFAKTPVYIEGMQNQIDRHTACSWYICLTNRWLAIRMSFLGNLFTVAVAIMVVVLPIPVELAGFAQNFASQYGATIATLVRQFTSLELDMNSAERVIEYVNLPTETTEGKDPPAAWPTEGRLEIRDLTVAYAQDKPAVLKGLSFTVEPRERVGVVGRTGAGKSSLTLALFRFLEASAGSIHIDGLDVSKLKLVPLRARLSIIPQDPVLFSGTIRYNLDPHEEHNDLVLRDALERVHLVAPEEHIITPTNGSTTPVLDENHPTGYQNSDVINESKNLDIFTSLSSPVAAGGLNLSQGQRQLLCLARAIVSKPKIMILDEATSAVDMTTDTLIQRSIREDFGDSTLLVIAHRLTTIVDFDKILVMDDGKAIEFGAPKELIQIKDGVFRSMVEESGDGSALIGSIMGSRAIKRGPSIRTMRNVYGM